MATTKKPTQTRAALLALYQAMIDGTNVNKSALPASFPVGAQTYKPDDVVVMLQKRITLGQATVTADAAHTAAVKAEQDDLAQTKLVVDTFRKLVILLFAQSPTVLATFGLQAPKARSSTAETKAQSAAKASAKRKAKKAAVDAVDAGSSANAATPAAGPATAQPAATPPAKPAS